MDNHPTIHEEPQSLPVILWDETNPRAVINMLPEVFAGRMKDHGQKKPEYFGIDERHLMALLVERKLRPTPTMGRLRMRFWQEYDYAQSRGKPMRLVQIYAGVCVQETWDIMLNYPHNAAWLLCPPANYMVMMEESLVFGVEQLRDILGLDHFDKVTKKVNVPLAELKAKIIAMIDQRLKGAVVQKVEQTTKSMNLNISATENQVASLAAKHTSEELEEMLKKLRKNPHAQPLPQSLTQSTTSTIIDVELEKK